MATITILSIRTIAADPPDPAQQEAIFAVKSSNTIYKYSRAGLSASLIQAQIQTALDGESDSLFASAAAAGAPTMTQGQVNQGNFAWQHWSNRDVFAEAAYNLETGLLTATGTLPNYQSILQSSLNSLLAVAGTQFQTNFDNERTAQGLPTGNTASAYTQAQCKNMDTFLRSWLAARKVDVLWAKSIVGLG